MTDIKQKLQDVHGQVQILAATNIASKLLPFVQSNPTAAVHSANPSDAMMLPANSHLTPATATANSVSGTIMPTPSYNNPSISVRLNDDFDDIFSSTFNDSGVDLQLPAMSNDNSLVNEISCNTNEVDDSQPSSYTRELLSSSEITPIYVKSRNRNNFAALLVERLFDVPTRLKSNVAGRGKERLDPEIMRYIKVKVFEFYECNGSEVEDEWKKCIKSIDDKSRALKRKKTSC